MSRVIGQAFALYALYRAVVGRPLRGTRYIIVRVRLPSPVERIYVTVAVA